MFRASLSFGRQHGGSFSCFKFLRHCGSVFAYKQKARQKEILNSGKSGQEVWTEAGYCISALLWSILHCMESRGQTDAIPKHCRVLKIPSKLQIKLKVKLEAELNVLEKCWFSCFVGLCWNGAVFCFGTEKKSQTHKKCGGESNKNQPNPTSKAVTCTNLHEFPWLAHLCQGWRVLPGHLWCPGKSVHAICVCTGHEEQGGIFFLTAAVITLLLGPSLDKPVIYMWFKWMKMQFKGLLWCHWESEGKLH